MAIIRIFFFDIGNTLGTVDVPNKTMAPFPDMVDLLRTVSLEFHFKIGVITDIPDGWSTSDVEALLDSAGLLRFVDRNAVITSKDAGAAKSEGPEIFSFAARQLGVEASWCLFVDDNVQNVSNASAAGMNAFQKGIALTSLRVPSSGPSVRFGFRGLHD